MTIDEAIANERAKADKARESEALFLHDDLIWNAKESHKRLEEHEKLAEWLEELKSYRASVFSGEMTQAMLKEARNKAIGDLVENAKTFASERNSCLISVDVLEMIAEEIKEGRKND